MSGRRRLADFFGLKRNLVIFVTARLINPGGQLVNQTEEQEEAEDVVEPPVLPQVPMYKK